MSGWEWRKSSFSAGDAPNCVELATDPVGAPHLRESTAPEVFIATSHLALRALLASVKADQLDGLAG